MIGSILAISFAASSAAAPERPASAASPGTPAAAARQLFERDWVLMNWALKFHDSNRDILIEPDEAQAAAAAFRKIADADGDGRVTTEEYRAARETILARY